MDERCKTCRGPMIGYSDYPRGFFRAESGECGRCRAAAQKQAEALEVMRRSKRYLAASWPTLGRWTALALLAALSLASPAGGQPSRVKVDTARWAFYSGSVGAPCTPCQHVVPIDRSARPWGPTGRASNYDLDTYIRRYAGDAANWACLTSHGCGAQCDVFHPTAGSVALEARVADEVGVPWGELTPEEQLDAAHGYACPTTVSPGGGGAGGGGATCATADPYRGTPRESLRCRYFLLGGRCREWTGWTPPWPICCPGASPCPPGEPEEPEPPPPESESDACETALDAALRAAAEAAEVCRAD